MEEIIITQQQLNDAFKLSKKAIRPVPFTARKVSTKIVKLAYPGETIETWIDTGDTITQELTRTVPIDGKYIIIIDDLKNSTTKKQKYFIPYEDFIKRYMFIDETPITLDMSCEFETTTMVKAKGIVTGFEWLKADTGKSGNYQKPFSWGEGFASGANCPGYWIAAVEKPTEWYFMPLTHFERDYKIIYATNK
tara:strand:- start:276 stop:854 length:579 start_codon:yes stop_codon:yes gene_type:complete